MAHEHELEHELEHHRERVVPHALADEHVQAAHRADVSGLPTLHHATPDTNPDHHVLHGLSSAPRGERVLFVAPDATHVPTDVLTAIPQRESIHHTCDVVPTSPVFSRATQPRAPPRR